MTDEAFAHLQAQLLQISNVITADRFSVKDATLVRRAFQSRNRARTFHQVDAGGIVWNQRIERVHDEIQHFISVQRPADCLGDVEQHAQLIDYRYACGWYLSSFRHKLTISK